MGKTIVITGSLDTKGKEFAFLKELIEKEGLETLVIDFGVMGEPAFHPDITRQEVAKAGGGDLAILASGEHKDEAMRVMAAGLAVMVRRLFDEGRLDGIIGMGGGGGTSLSTAAMRAPAGGRSQSDGFHAGRRGCQRLRWNPGYHLHAIHRGCGWLQSDQPPHLYQCRGGNCRHGENESIQRR